MAATFLCQINDIADPGSRGFRVTDGDTAKDIMVIRRGNEVFGYINSCPHTGVCLDWQPGQFLAMDSQSIICATHGAEFRIEDGYCVGGPCAGDSLVPVRITIDAAGRLTCTLPRYDNDR